MKTILSKCVLLGVMALSLLTACNNDQSYADRLNEERYAVNSYLANHRVVMSVPKDSVFEVGEDAPFYRLDNDGNIYMVGELGAEGVILLTDSQQMALLGQAIGKYITINTTLINEKNGRIISRKIQRVQN